MGKLTVLFGCVGFHVIITLLFTILLPTTDFSFIESDQISQFLYSNESEIESDEFVEFPKTWENSGNEIPLIATENWKNYLSVVNTQRNNLNIKNEWNYCARRDEYVRNRKLTFDSKGFPVQKDRHNFSEYMAGNLVQNVIRSIGNDELPNHTLSAPKADLVETTFPLRIDIFFCKLIDFHKWHVVGSHYACDNQKYNHIPENEVLINKDAMTLSVKEYGKYFIGREHCFSPWDFMPETYVLSEADDCAAIMPLLKGGDDSRSWLIKKSHNVHNARGIIPYKPDQVEKDNTMIQELTEVCEKRRDYNRQAYIVQHYIEHPLLIDNKKFDFRIYGFWANLDPLMVLYHDGFVRIAMNEYDENATDLKTIVTTMGGYQAPAEGDKPEWNMTIDQFGEYLYNQGRVSKDWVDTFLRHEFKKMILHMARMSYPKMTHHPATFEVFGIDFMLDSELNLWFLEILSSPAYTGDTDDKLELQTEMIKSTLDLETALLYNADFDAILEETNYQWIYDGRKEGMARYHGLLSKDCL